MIEEKEHTGRQRQRAEKRSNPHPQRQLPGVRVVIDIESGEITLQQLLLMTMQAGPLRLAQLQHLLSLKARKLTVEYTDIVGTLLGITAV